MPHGWWRPLKIKVRECVESDTWLKPSSLSTGMGDHPGSVTKSMSSSDVGLGVEVDRGKLDQLLLPSQIASSWAGS